METIPFVNKEHGELARTIEGKLLAISSESGILFVGVEVTPTEAGQDPIYQVLVGVDRNLKIEQAIEHLVTLTLSEEFLQGADIKTEVRRGCTRG